MTRSRVALVLLLASSLALPLSGCAISPVRAAPPSPASSPEREPSSVPVIDVYCRAADVPYSYKELGLVTVLAWGREREAMLRELREKARGQGAEAVVIVEESNATSPSLDYTEGSCTIDPVVLRGIAIVPDED
jgi:hypothetical protein